MRPSIDRPVQELLKEDPRQWQQRFAPTEFLKGIERPPKSTPTQNGTNGVERGYANYEEWFDYEWGNIRISWAKGGDETVVREIAVLDLVESTWFCVYLRHDGYRAGPWWLKIGEILEQVLRDIADAEVEHSQAKHVQQRQTSELWQRRAAQFSKEG